MKIKFNILLLIFFSLLFVPSSPRRNRLAKRFKRLRSGGTLSQAIKSGKVKQNSSASHAKNSLSSRGQLTSSIKSDAIDNNLSLLEGDFLEDTLNLEVFEGAGISTHIDTKGKPGKKNIKKEAKAAKGKKKEAKKEAPKKKSTIKKDKKKVVKPKKEVKKAKKKERPKKKIESKAKTEPKKDDKKAKKKKGAVKKKAKIKDISEKEAKEKKKLKEIDALLKGKTKQTVITKSEKKEEKAEDIKLEDIKLDDKSSEPKKKTEEKVKFNFENVDLKNVATYIEDIFDVKFVTDENILTAEGKVRDGVKGFSGSKLTFKTNKPLSRQNAWNLFVTFLDLSGLTLIPQSDPNIYRVRLKVQSLTSAVPTYIGVDPEILPDNDTMIRYVYFLKDCPLATINSVVGELKSATSKYIPLQDHSGFILADTAYNIRVLMKIVKELDKISMPQTMSVLKLHNVDVKEVVAIFNKIHKKDQEGNTRVARIFGPRRVPTALFFPENVKIIEEPRTNSLVLLGPVKSIKKIEDFVAKYIDVDVETPYSPLYVYDLKYADATDIANIMNKLVQFGQKQSENGGAAFRGALRGGDKYFKDMQFTAEKSGNRVVIRGDYDDYLKAKKIIDGLDEAPLQVAIEILILGIDLAKDRELGAQIRNKYKDPHGSRVNFQTSGPRGIVQNPCDQTSGSSSLIKGAERLLGDLISLVGSAAPGHTVLTLGSDKFGVWGIFNVLQSVGNTQVISNPFLVATNNTPALVQIGETRRITSQKIFSASTNDVEAKSDYAANLTVNVTPKINSDGMIQMKLDVSIDSFVEGTNAAKLTKSIKTYALVSDKEILALGGLVRNKVDNSLTSVPILGKIPLLGWFFKNKKKVTTKEDLLVLISAHVIEPNVDITDYTKRHYKEYRYTIKQYRQEAENTRDPVDMAFFKDYKDTDSIDKFIFKRGKPPKVKKESKKKKKKRNTRTKKTKAPVVNERKNKRKKRRGSQRKKKRRED